MGEVKTWFEAAPGHAVSPTIPTVFGVVLAVVMWGPRPGRPLPSPSVARPQDVIRTEQGDTPSV